MYKVKMRRNGKWAVIDTETGKKIGVLHFYKSLAESEARKLGNLHARSKKYLENS